MCWDLSNILNVLGIGVALYIYHGWTNQKQKEVVANYASITLEEIEYLRQNIVKAYYEGTVDDFFIDNMKEKKGAIEFTLSMIKEINENLEYEYYINALSKLITALEADPNSIGERRYTDNVMSHTFDLGYHLRKLILYIWK